MGLRLAPGRPGSGFGGPPGILPFDLCARTPMRSSSHSSPTQMQSGNKRKAVFRLFWTHPASGFRLSGRSRACGHLTTTTVILLGRRSFLLPVLPLTSPWCESTFSDVVSLLLPRRPPDGAGDTDVALTHPPTRLWYRSSGPPPAPCLLGVSCRDSRLSFRVGYVFLADRGLSTLPCPRIPR